MEGCATFPSPALPLLRYTSVAIRDLEVLPIELQDGNGLPKRSILPTRNSSFFGCVPRPRL